jgi:hypothetical protein
MVRQLERRLKELKGEFESGKKSLADLEVHQSNIRSNMLRISGAIQVLEELLNQDQSGIHSSGNPDYSEKVPTGVGEESINGDGNR